MSKRAERFLKQLGVRSTDAALCDATCGLHSGIPECCIAFYVMVWDYNRQPEYAALSYKAGANYIPCPSCLLSKRFAPIKKCRCKHSDLWDYQQGISTGPQFYFL